MFWGDYCNNINLLQSYVIITPSLQEIFSTMFLINKNVKKLMFTNIHIYIYKYIYVYIYIYIYVKPERFGYLLSGSIPGSEFVKSAFKLCLYVYIAIQIKCEVIKLTSECATDVVFFFLKCFKSSSRNLSGNVGGGLGTRSL